MKFKIYFHRSKTDNLAIFKLQNTFFYQWSSIYILCRKSRIFNRFSVTSRGKIMNYNQFDKRNVVQNIPLIFQKNTKCNFYYFQGKNKFKKILKSKISLQNIHLKRFKKFINVTIQNSIPHVYKTMIPSVLEG